MQNYFYPTDVKGATARSDTTVITGKVFARRLKKLSQRRRALVAYGLQTGEITLQNLTRAQVWRLTGIAPCYLTAISRATDCERLELEKGMLSLSALQHRRRRPVSDREIERVVVDIGPDRIFQILDRLTAPRIVAAE